jgi:RHS repeat-associated protein
LSLGHPFKRILFENGYYSGGNYYFYLRDHLGNNCVVANANGSTVQKTYYYPFGKIIGNGESTGQSLQPYKFGGKEEGTMHGLNLYDFDARQLDKVIPRFTAMDPLAEKYYNISSYAYCGNNPVRFIDPMRMEVEVALNEDGIYTIIGGAQNSDRNIYIMKDGKRTGEVLGQTMTEYSFFGSNNEVIMGATINPNDQSGQNFIDNEIIGDNPNILSYMANATGGEKYDFKSRGDVKGADNTANHYRGMPLKDVDENTVYGSARDIGNYGAGYVAGKAGLDWKTARMGFDLLESYQNGRLSTEAMVTQRAERLGYNVGSEQYKLRNASNWLNLLFNRPTALPKGYLGLP